MSNPHRFARLFPDWQDITVAMADKVAEAKAVGVDLRITLEPPHAEDRHVIRASTAAGRFYEKSVTGLDSAISRGWAVKEAILGIPVEPSKYAPDGVTAIVHNGEVIAAFKGDAQNV